MPHMYVYPSYSNVVYGYSHTTCMLIVGSSKLIPSVCVVLEGGPGTLKTVKTAIESGTPAVIVEVCIV